MSSAQKSRKRSRVGSAGRKFNSNAECEAAPFVDPSIEGPFTLHAFERPHPVLVAVVVRRVRVPPYAIGHA